MTILISSISCHLITIYVWKTFYHKQHFLSGFHGNCVSFINWYKTAWNDRQKYKEMEIKIKNTIKLLKIIKWNKKMFKIDCEKWNRQIFFVW